MIQIAYPVLVERQEREDEWRFGISERLDAFMVRAKGGQCPLYNMTKESGETLDWWQIGVEVPTDRSHMDGLPSGKR